MEDCINPREHNMDRVCSALRGLRAGFYNLAILPLNCRKSRLLRRPCLGSDYGTSD